MICMTTWNFTYAPFMINQFTLSAMPAQSKTNNNGDGINGHSNCRSKQKRCSCRKNCWSRCDSNVLLFQTLVCRESIGYPRMQYYQIESKNFIAPFTDETILALIIFMQNHTRQSSNVFAFCENVWIAYALHIVFIIYYLFIYWENILDRQWLVHISNVCVCVCCVCKQLQRVKRCKNNVRSKQIILRWSLHFAKW